MLSSLLLAASSAVASAAAVAATPPTFAKDFYVGKQDGVAINQGGYNAPEGATCCSLEHASQCKVQAINMGSDTFEQGSQERTRSDGPTGSIVNWWGKVKKQMAIVPGSAMNSSHKWACAQFCPVDGEFASSIRIGDGQKGWFDKPKDRGQATITQPKAIGGVTKTCERWTWTETILGLIPIESTDFYVTSDDSPAPFYSHSVIKPFNKPVGVENSSYVGYKPMDVSSYFDIDLDSVAKCPQSNNCQQDSKQQLLGGTPAAMLALTPGASLYEHAKLMATAVGASHAAADPPPSPPAPDVSFGTDFVSHEDGLVMIAQGAAHGSNGDPCCPNNSPMPQCQVQLQHYGGVRYFDLSHSRARFEDTVGSRVTVDDYKAKKSMLINVTNGKDTCQEYCPIDPDDKMEALDPFDRLDPVKDIGKVTYEGQPAEHYQWKDKILKIITMQSTDFYADITNKKAATPLFMTTSITPFGRKPPIGTQNHTWSNFTHGPPPAAKFDIAGVDTCPRAKNCGQQSMQAHRLHMRQHHTFARYHVDLDAF